MGEMRGLERSGDVEKGGGQREQEKERERERQRGRQIGKIGDILVFERQQTNVNSVQVT